MYLHREIIDFYCALQNKINDSLAGIEDHDREYSFTDILSDVHDMYILIDTLRASLIELKNKDK